MFSQEHSFYKTVFPFVISNNILKNMAPILKIVSDLVFPEVGLLLLTLHQVRESGQESCGPLNPSGVFIYEQQQRSLLQEPAQISVLPLKVGGQEEKTLHAGLGVEREKENTQSS